MIEIDGDNQAEEEVGEVEMVEDDEVVEEHGTCLLLLMFRNLVMLRRPAARPRMRRSSLSTSD